MNDADREIVERFRLLASDPVNEELIHVDHADPLLALIESQAAEIERLEIEQKTCNGSCDIALARRQVGPDAIVPGNARECAELWEREASRQTAKLERLREVVEQLPKTADGVPIVPGMTLYRYTGSAKEYANLRLSSQFELPVAIWDAYFSTDEAAQAAAAKGESDG